MHLGKRLIVGFIFVSLSGTQAGPWAFAGTADTAASTFNIEEILRKSKEAPLPGEQQSGRTPVSGIFAEHPSTEMFDEIDRAFQKHFQLATGPTPQALLKQLAPPQRILEHELKEEFCRYGILSAQYASYGKTKEAMSVYNWLEQNYKNILAPNSSFFKELSSAVGLYLCAAGDYADSITCLDNALKEPVDIKDEKQRVAFVMTNFGLARNYHKLGDDPKAFKYLAQAKAVNDINVDAPVQPAQQSPPPAVQPRRSRYHTPRLLPSGYVHI